MIPDPTLSNCTKLRELKIRWNCHEIHLISTIRSMEIRKIIITGTPRLPANDKYWVELDSVLLRLVERKESNQELAVEIHVTVSGRNDGTRANEEEYLPTFRANPKGLVKFVY